jgi:hypothetical protein
MSASMIFDPPQELARRNGDGLDVALLWRRSDGKLTVSVTDSKSQDWFELLVTGERALDAFYHPYAYRA